MLIQRLWETYSRAYRSPYKARGEQSSRIKGHQWATHIVFCTFCIAPTKVSEILILCQIRRIYMHECPHCEIGRLHHINPNVQSREADISKEKHEGCILCHSRVDRSQSPPKGCSGCLLPSSTQNCYDGHKEIEVHCAMHSWNPNILPVW